MTGEDAGREGPAGPGEDAVHQRPAGPGVGGAPPDADAATWDRMGLGLLGVRGCGCMLLLYIIMALAVMAVGAVSLLFT